MLKRGFGAVLGVFFALVAFAQINYFDKGFDAFQREKYDNAVYFYSLYLEDFPTSNTYFNRALSYYQLGEFELAIQDFNLVIAKEPDDFEAWYNRGLANLDAGNIDSAIRDYNQSLLLQPDHDKTLTGLGLAYLRSEQYEKSIEVFSKAILLNDKIATNYYNRGLANEALENFEKAELDYSVAVRLDDSKADYYISRAAMYHDLGRFDVSVIDYTSAIYLSPESETLYYNRGIAQYDLKQFDEAISDFEEVLLYDSMHIDALWYLALAHKASGNEELAKGYYEQVEQLDPDYEYLWAIDKNQLVLKKFIKDNWIYAIALIVLLLAALFFVRRLVKGNQKTPID